MKGPCTKLDVRVSDEKDRCVHTTELYLRENMTSYTRSMKDKIGKIYDISKVFDYYAHQ